MIETRGAKFFYVVNYFLVSCVVLACFLPFVNLVATSFSSEHAVISGMVSLWPVEATIKTYRLVFIGTPLLQSMRNSVVLTLMGTAINMAMTILAAYALSRKRFFLRRGTLKMITTTMMIGAGLIPNFLLIKSLGLMNTYWALWLPSAMSTYNMIVMKTFFESLPDSLEESAMIDGASDPIIMLRIILPLSLASLATITLFYAVGWWNVLQGVLIYITSSKLFTLQKLLNDMINATSLDMVSNIARDTSDVETVAQESIKAAAVVVATVPILIVYPFLQKYFVKGVMIGSIKG